MSTQKILAIFLGYAALFMISLFFFGDQYNVLYSINLLNWDAEHYNYIRTIGYDGKNVAFFPLFPKIWQILSVNELGITIINSSIFFGSFWLLIKKFRINKLEEILLYLSIPVYIFFHLPYSEAFFFLFSVFIIIGLKNKNYPLLFAGLFFSVLTRPAFTIFIPGLIITEYICNEKDKKLLRIALYILTALIAVAIVGIIQHNETGEWFKFFSAQKEWDNRLRFPKFPLTSWSGYFVLRLDGFALFIGLASGITLLFQILKIKRFQVPTMPAEVIFSLAYLGGITLSVLMFREGSLFSLNRFVFACPFIMVLMNFWLKQNFTFQPKQLYIIFTFLFLFWLLLGSYVHIRELLKFALLSVYILLIFVLKFHKVNFQKLGFWIFICLNFIFQLILYIRFLENKWVG